MNDQELADKALKAIGWHPEIRKQAGYRGDSQFVRHWDVAGAMMEKALAVSFMTLAAVIAAAINMDGNAKSGSLPRAINEAGVEALKK